MNENGPFEILPCKNENIVFNESSVYGIYGDVYDTISPTASIKTFFNDNDDVARYRGRIEFYTEGSHIYVMKHHLTVHLSSHPYDLMAIIDDCVNCEGRGTVVVDRLSDYHGKQ